MLKERCLETHSKPVNGLYTKKKTHFGLSMLRWKEESYSQWTERTESSKP
jgi:hypothetical protein